MPSWIPGFDMTDPRGVSLSAVLPGMPQMLKGRWGVGGLSLIVWLGLLSVLLTRWARFAAGWGGPLDHQIASLTVVAGLVGAWGWSMLDVSRTVKIGRDGTSQWTLAAEAFRKNRIAVIGGMVVVCAYLIALVTPLIAPHDPATQASLETSRLLAPGGVFTLGTICPETSSPA